MWALVIMVVCFLLAVVIANLIPYTTRNPGTAKRRVWFWILLVAAGAIGYVVNYYIAGSIFIPNLYSEYLMHAAIAAGVAVVVYLILGFIVSKVFSSSKLGTWF